MAAAHFAHGPREALREDGEFILFRSRYRGRAPMATVLLLAPVSARPSRESIQKLEHEPCLKADLDPEWAAVPLALVEHEARPAGSRVAVLVGRAAFADAQTKAISFVLDLTQRKRAEAAMVIK
jgi:hypothetical protein